MDLSCTFGEFMFVMNVVLNKLYSSETSKYANSYIDYFKLTYLCRIFTNNRCNKIGCSRCIYYKGNYKDGGVCMVIYAINKFPTV